ncbi:MAG: hypothetical protein DLM52_02855 [Chthoniobacterales bacterium]|nr:MAG: hypothetical protein DLM52_02855 [Chthoniobacterales bacterium]
MPAIRQVDQTFVFKRGVRDLIVSRKLRASGFDCVIDFTRNDRSASLALLSGAPQRIVTDRLRRKSPVRARVYTEFADCAMPKMHTVDYNLALLHPLGISGAPAEPILQLPPYAADAAAALIQRELGEQPFAIFHPGSTRAEKFWEPDRWAKAMAFAKNELELQPVITSGNSPLEHAHITQIQSHARIPVIDLTARLDLLTLTALIARARLLVTVDSAPMHLASAVKTPQVILFGPTNPFHWRPRTSPAAILFGAAREPLQQYQPRAPTLPMNQISTAAVIDAMRSMHTAPAASAV